ncbi:MAG: YebC/PmpR family DNA-binding transcriptional regulator, partial [bacterium]|nr:YebC/PmpR family DNA-binding transcriptional regulator [bacterium]
MSGHSKWHNIQERKGKQDKKRSNVFSMYSKKISIAARAGGGDQSANFSLRILIDKAKEAGMPKDNIERAIKRGTGEDGEVNLIEECVYEGYGPGGVAVLIKTLSDNKNRTVSEVKHILSRFGGSMGSAGSVMWMFEQWGMVEVEKNKITEKNISDDDFQMSLIEAGAEDISEEEGMV